MTEFRYDVAFSLLADDEPFARKLDERLGEYTLRRFLYSDKQKQKELAGADGIDVFSETFRRESRSVVVLYRDGWGKTRWTSIEETAIKARGLEDMNFDSVLFVKLDPSSSLPSWVPPQRIYVEVGKIDLDGLAATIAQKVKEAGVEVKKIGLAGKAEIAAKKLAYKEERRDFLGPNGRGIGEANAAAEELKTEFARCAAEAESLGLKYEQTTRSRGGVGEGAVVGHRHSATFFWRPRALNSLDQAELTVEVWKGPSPLLNRRFVTEEPKCLRSETFEFDLAPSGATGWRKKGAGVDRLLGSDEIAEQMVARMIDAITKDEER